MKKIDDVTEIVESVQDENGKQEQLVLGILDFAKTVLLRFDTISEGYKCSTIPGVAYDIIALTEAPIPTPAQMELMTSTGHTTDSFQKITREAQLAKRQHIASPNDISEQIADFCGDPLINTQECVDDGVSQLEAKIFREVVGISLPEGGSLRINASHAIPTKLVLTGTGVPQSLTNLTTADYPPESVVSRDVLFQNMVSGFSELGIECTLEQIERLTPKEIGLVTLLALSPKVGLYIDDRSDLLIKVESDQKIPATLAFRHIGPGIRVIGAAVLEHQLLKNILSDKLIGLVDLPFENDLALAQSIVSGDFNKKLVENLEQIIPLSEFNSLTESKNTLETRELGLLQTASSLSSIGALIGAQPALEDIDVVSRRRESRDQRIAALNYSFRTSETIESDAQIQKQIEELQAEQELDIPIDNRDRLLSFIAPLFNEGQYEFLKKVLSAAKPSLIEGSRAIVIRMHTLFGNDLAEEIITCIYDGKSLPSLSSITAAQEEINTLIDGCGEKLGNLNKQSPKIKFREDISMLLELLSHRPQ